MTMIDNGMKFAMVIAMFLSVKKTIQEYNKPIVFPKKKIRRYNNNYENNIFTN